MTKDELHSLAIDAGLDYYDQMEELNKRPLDITDVIEGMLNVMLKTLCSAPFKEPGDFRYYPCEISKQTFIPPDLEN